MVDHIPAAGKLIPRGHGAKECLQSPTDELPPQTADSLKKFRRQAYPTPGERRTYYSFVGDPDRSNITQGIISKTSFNASSLVNPPVQSAFQRRLQDLKDASYFSKNRAPLGQSHDQSPGLPNGLNPLEKKFGMVNKKDDSAGELVNPFTTKTQPETEQLAAELYKRSHGVYDVGERMDRNYDWSCFSRESLYGVPTPHDNTGLGVRASLKWSTNQGSITRKQLDDFRYRTQPELGLVHDPIEDTLFVDINKDHIFGVTVVPDEYSAGELVHMTGPSAFLHSSSWNPGMLVTIRQHLKKNNFTKFNELHDAFHQSANKEDAENEKIGANIVKDIFYQFLVPLEQDMVELLLAWSSDEEMGVAYIDMIALMNWMQPIPPDISERVCERIKEPLYIEPSKVDAYRTSSEQVQAAVGSLHTNDYRTFGVPAIRCDRPAPKIKRNYGDESDAYGLLYPSVYSNHGLYEKDFFTPRPPEEIRQIYISAGIAISDDAFESLWEQAAGNDPTGQVSVETFRAVLENIHI